MLIVLLLQVIEWVHGVIVIHQDALGRPFEIIELAASDRPQYARYCQTDKDQCQPKHEQQGDGSHAALA